jgi:hypothetical protein
MIDPQKKILVIGRAVQETFSLSEWTEIGYLTRTYECTELHSGASSGYPDGNFLGLGVWPIIAPIVAGLSTAILNGPIKVVAT